MEIIEKGKKIIKDFISNILDNPRVKRKIKEENMERKKFKEKRQNNELNTENIFANKIKKDLDLFLENKKVRLNVRIESMFPNMNEYIKYIKYEYDKYFPSESERHFASWDIFRKNIKGLEGKCQCYFENNPTEEIKKLDLKLYEQAVNDIKDKKIQSDKNISEYIKDQHILNRWDILEKTQHLHLEKKILDEMNMKNTCFECLEFKMFRFVKMEMERRIEKALLRLNIVFDNFERLQNYRVFFYKDGVYDCIVDIYNILAEFMKDSELCKHVGNEYVDFIKSCIRKYEAEIKKLTLFSGIKANKYDNLDSDI